jgi:hypothetical protein
MIKLQILGVNGHISTNSLMMNTLDAVKELDLIVKLEEINDIDQFIQYDLFGVPALTINGKLAFQQTIPEVDELVDILGSFIQPLKKRA